MSIETPFETIVVLLVVIATVVDGDVGFSKPRRRASLAARVSVFPVPAPAVSRIAGVSGSRDTHASCSGSSTKPTEHGQGITQHRIYTLLEHSFERI